MNKKFLSVVLFGALMAGSSVTFTGCIDNDEPAGIETLRGAKAELLKAKAAVELAKVGYVNAQTAEMAAQARQTEALALQAELTAKQMELDNALQEATDAETIAAAKAAVAEINAKLDQNKLNWEAERLKAETELAQAQKDFEDAMKAIELSKNYLSEAELDILGAVQGKLTAAKDAVYGYDYKFTWEEDGEEQSEIKHYVGSKEALDARYKEYEAAATDIENYITKEALEADLTNAQASLDFYTAKLNLKLEALATLKDGEAYQAWLKLKEEYTAKKDSLETEIAAKNSKANKIIAEQTPAIDALGDAIKEAIAIKATVATPEADKDSTFAVSTAIKTDLTTDDFGNGFVTYADGVITAKFLKGADVLAFVRTDEDELNNSYDAASYATLLDDKFAFADGKNTAYKQAVDDIDNAITNVNKKKAAIPSLDTEKAEGLKKVAKDNLDKANEAKTKGVTAWKNSITAWKTAEGYTTEDADKKALTETALKAYNDALDAIALMPSGTEAEKTAKAKAEIKARQAFADAIVKYYNAAAPLQLTSNKVSLKVTVGTGASAKETWLSKTVKEWLTDSENKDVYLAELITYFGNPNKFWTVGKAEKADAGQQPTAKAEGALATLKTGTEIKNVWKTASQTLFGYTLGVNTYGEGRETEPTETEIEKVWNKSEKTDAAGNPAGLCGVVLTREVELTKATENVEKAAQFDKVVAQLTAWKNSLAAAKTAYIAEYQDELDAVTAGQKTVTEKVVTPITALGIAKDQALLGEIEAVLEFSIDGDYTNDNNAIIAHVKALITKLEAEIGVKKGAFNSETGKYETESTKLYLNIETAEADVFKAQKLVDLYNAGELTAQYVVDTKKEAYEAAKAQYEKDLEVFNYWNDKLEELMKTLYSGSSAE